MSRSSSSIHSYHSTQDWPGQSHLRPMRNRTPDPAGEDVEQVVTKLLRMTKTLLEALTKWSRHAQSKDEIKDIYEDLEKQFNLVNKAFDAAGVVMFDLLWIPDQLKKSVESAMEEEPSPESLDAHLPRIRDVIVHLLHGLKSKQTQLREKDRDRAVSRSSSSSSNNGININTYANHTKHAPYYGDHTPHSRGSSFSQPHRYDSRLSQSDYDPQSGYMPQPSVSYDSAGSNEALEQRLKRTDDLKKRSSVRRTSIYNNKAFKIGKHAPPVPALSPHSETPVPETTTAEEEETKTALILFLQIGDEVKKVSYAGEISISALCMLFVETFGYSSRQNDFPSIYIREPQAGVSYQLEDLSEVKDKSVLSLHTSGKTDEADIEEQKKRQDEEEETKRKRWLEEITCVFTKELAETRQMLSDHMDAIKQETLQAKSVETPREVHKESPLPPPPRSPIPQPPKAQPSPAIPVQLPKAIQSQLNEVKALRQELLVMRQLQREMHEGTGEVVQELQKKGEEWRKMVSEAHVSTTQTEIEGSREKLLEDSDNITERLEKLQDAIDEMKNDLTRRKCRPSDGTIRHCREERKVLADNIDAFGKYITSVKPVWKGAWERELQTILKDQTILKEQEGLLSDMKEDLEALGELFENIEKLCASQAKARPVPREYRPPPAEEGFEGMASVLKQVTTIDVDQEERMRALEKADKMRQIKLSNRIDEFEEELTSFVDQKKLKKTGGAQEIDRLRDEKNKALLKNLYSVRRGKQPTDTEGETDRRADEEGQCDEDGKALQAQIPHDHEPESKAPQSKATEDEEEEEKEEEEGEET